jgi:HAD superfamily hydrolase (TIGR01509 family)
VGGIRATIFDLDNTLAWLGLDAVPYRVSRFYRVKLAKFYIESRIPLDVVIRETSPYHLFVAVYEYLSNANRPPEEAERIQRKAASILDEFETAIFNANNVKALPGALEVLEKLKGLGVKICVVSINCRAVVEAALESIGASKLVDLCFTRSSPGRCKPFPDHVLRCLEELKLSSSEALMVGDDMLDLKAAKRAGVRFVGIAGVTYLPEELRYAGADFVVGDLYEAWQILEREVARSVG